MRRPSPDGRLRWWATAALAVALSVGAASVVAAGVGTREAVDVGRELDRVATLDSLVRQLSTHGSTDLDVVERLAAELGPELADAVETLTADVEAGVPAADSVAAVLALTDERAVTLRARLDELESATITPSMIGLVLALLVVPAAVVTAFHLSTRRRLDAESHASVADRIRRRQLSLDAPAPTLDALPAIGGLPMEQQLESGANDRPDDDPLMHEVLDAVIGQMVADGVLISIDDRDRPDDPPAAPEGAAPHDLGPLLDEAAGLVDVPVVIESHQPTLVLAERRLFVTSMTDVLRSLGRIADGAIGVFVSSGHAHVEITVGAPVPAAPDGDDALDRVAVPAEDELHGPIRWAQVDGAVFAVLSLARPEVSRT